MGADGGVGALTDGGDDGDGEVEGACKLPLAAGAVRLSLQRQALQLAVVLGGEAVLPPELAPLLGQQPLAPALCLGLERVEDRGAHQQVGQDAQDERGGAHALPPHGGASSRAVLRAVPTPAPAAAMRPDGRQFPLRRGQHPLPALQEPALRAAGVGHPEAGPRGEAAEGALLQPPLPCPCRTSAFVYPPAPWG